MKRRIYEKEKYSDQFSAAFSGSRNLVLCITGRLLISILPSVVFVLVLVLAVGLVLAGKKGLRYGSD